MDWEAFHNHSSSKVCKVNGIFIYFHLGKKKHQPKVPMKAVPWTVVKESEVKGTIWEKVSDEKVKLDVEALENSFAVKKSTATTSSEGGASQKEQDIPKISLLSADRTKNVELILGKLRLKNDVLVDALFQCNE